MTEQLWPPRLTPGTRLLELGGGDQPMIRPNLDTRRVPGVDSLLFLLATGCFLSRSTLK